MKKEIEEIIEEEIKILKSKGMGGIARIHVRASLLRVMQSQQADIKKMLIDYSEKHYKEDCLDPMSCDVARMELDILKEI